VNRCVEFARPIGCGLQVQWVLYAVATNSAVVVSISYWSFIIIFVNNGTPTGDADFSTRLQSALV